ncbi:ROK family transcriptional regulator [Martelella sp. HB161492]|uniref:ROK family transcriptional regulator n=1 Tax=Martelella sp. HB161492 TaxID=2720726 RepID=UPI00159187D3|nr:ROK family transcriptional regulator [Martelella sp. HB161492]
MDKEIDTDCHLAASEREILRIVLHAGSVARSDIARKTSLAQQSVHRIIDNLERRGYLRFGDVRISGRGKPSPMVSVDPEHYATVGLSVSTENIRFCLLDLTGKPIVQDVSELEASTPEEAMTILQGRLDGWRKNVAAGRGIIGAGISMQGFRTGPGDRFQPPDRLADWQGRALEALLNDATGLPSFAENNATASALAEFYLGGGGTDAETTDCLVYLSFNHGFGAGIYSVNSPFRGGHGNAGEIGAIFTADELDLRPALSGLIEMLGRHGVELRSVTELTARFDPDWPGMTAWLDAVRPQLHLALRALQAIVDPTMIVFGGEAPAALRTKLLAAAKGAFRDRRLPRPTLVMSELDGDPAHLGAGLLPLHQLVF